MLKTALSLLLLLPLAAQAVCCNSVFIANGDSPPNPLNIVDASDDYSESFVRVATGPSGTPTMVSIEDGSQVYGVTTTVGSSVRMDGGSVNTQFINLGEAHISGGMIGLGFDSHGVATISGGAIGVFARTQQGSLLITGGHVAARNDGSEGWVVAGGPPPIGGVPRSATITIRGGTFADYLMAFEGSVIYIEGQDFSVDGINVAFGALTPDTGLLRGILRSGELLENRFYAEGSFAAPPYGNVSTGGSIILVQAVPELSTVVLWVFGLVVLLGRLAMVRVPRSAVSLA